MLFIMYSKNSKIVKYRLINNSYIYTIKYAFKIQHSSTISLIATLKKISIPILYHCYKIFVMVLVQLYLYLHSSLVGLIF